MCGAVCVLALSASQKAVAQSQDRVKDTNSTPTPVRHEPVPVKRGLTAAPGASPAVLYESDDEMPRNDRSPDVAPRTSDEIVYRTDNLSRTSETTTVQNVRDVVQPDRNTSREPWLNYHVVFDPAVIPFKRNSAKDTVRADGGLTVGDTVLRDVPIRAPEADDGRSTFLGSVLVEFSPGIPVPIPSVSPESRLLSVEVAPDAQAQFFRDGADNLYVQASLTGRARVSYVLDAPHNWFTAKSVTRARLNDIPQSMRPMLPKPIARDAEKVLRRIGISKRDSYKAALRKLVWWFRSFSPGTVEAGEDSLYLTLALSQRGVCRHRSYAFVVTAHALGIPARYVSNEAHVFVEVYAPSAGWLRIDLGGGAQGMNVRGGEDHEPYAADLDDPWGFPPGFRFGYSQRAARGGQGAGNPVEGLSSSNATGMPASVPDGSKSATPYVFRVNRNKQPSFTQLTSVVSSAFRGEGFQVAGRVTTMSGQAVRGGLVRIQLMNSELTQRIVILGHVRTDENGAFSTRVAIPLEVAPGEWQVIAEFAGDEIHGPSHSE